MLSNKLFWVENVTFLGGGQNIFWSLLHISRGSRPTTPRIYAHELNTIGSWGGLNGSRCQNPGKACLNIKRTHDGQPTFRSMATSICVRCLFISYASAASYLCSFNKDQHPYPYPQSSYVMFLAAVVGRRWVHAAPNDPSSHLPPHSTRPFPETSPTPRDTERDSSWCLLCDNVGRHGRRGCNWWRRSNSQCWRFLNI